VDVRENPTERANGRSTSRASGTEAVSTPLGKQRDAWWQVLELIAGIEATATQKYFLTLVHRHTNWRKGYAWAAQKTLGQEMCVSESSAKRTYRWAKKLGVINSRLVRTGKLPKDQHNEYSLNIERLRELQRPVEAMVPQRTAIETEDGSVLLNNDALGASTPLDKAELGTPKRSSRGQITPELGANRTQTRSIPAPIGFEVRQGMSEPVKQSLNPLPAPSFESRQVHANVPLQEHRQQKDGRGAIHSIEQFQRPVFDFGASRVPPVIRYIERNGTLPPYIVDESHLIFDGQGEYAGYFDRNGNRHNQFNEFESIAMAQSRTSKEAIKNCISKLSNMFGGQDKTHPLQTTGSQRLDMLRSGTEDETEAKRWSAVTGVPADIYLTKDADERAELFRRWREQARQDDAPHQLGGGG
jgi:hypothetical protein